MLFRLPGRDVTAGNFAADAVRLAQRLPEARYAINLCAGRYAFAVGFAAALLRGQTSLLTSDRSPHRLRALATQHADAIALCDDEADLPLPLPRVAVPPPGDDRAASPLIPSEQCAAVVFTSGSTGEPVAHTKLWGALAARSRDAGAAFGLDPAHPATIVGTVPPQHMYGFETTVLWPLHAAVLGLVRPRLLPRRHPQRRRRRAGRAPAGDDPAAAPHLGV